MRTLLILLVFICSNLTCYSQRTGVEISGDAVQFILPGIAFASTFVWDEGTKPTMQFIKTMGTSFVVTHSLKWIINKPRPNGGEHSFPSGHTSAAFTGAAFIQKRYGWKAGIPSYLLAGYVGWTRVYVNKHDYWDVFGGALIGIGSAYLFTKPYTNYKVNVAIHKQNGIFLLNLSIPIE